MGRGVSSGGGQSSLGYLFGGGETVHKAQSIKSPPQPVNKDNDNAEANNSASKPAIDSQIPAGIQANPTNNYFRADGQNCGNFITVNKSILFFVFCAIQFIIKIILFYLYYVIMILV